MENSSGLSLDEIWETREEYISTRDHVYQFSSMSILMMAVSTWTIIYFWPKFIMKNSENPKWKLSQQLISLKVYEIIEIL